MMQLSKRLQAVAALVPSTECMADVGTDHGYIPIYLVQQGITKRAIAMDVRSGPLERAQQHISECRLESYISTRLSDGLAALQNGEVQSVVIAGMGGATIQGILQAGGHIIEQDTVLVLQPQSEIKEFRQYLWEHDFCILQEDMVFEDGKFYPMMKVQKRQDLQNADLQTAHQKCAYSQLELLYGPLLLEGAHPVLKEFLLWQLEQKEKVRQQLTSHAKAEVKEKRMEQLCREISWAKQALETYNR